MPLIDDFVYLYNKTLLIEKWKGNGCEWYSQEKQI